MNTSTPEDPVWEAAWRWVMLEHEQALTPGLRGELVAWLQADPRHLATHREASRLWLLAGLVPPAHLAPGDPSDTSD